MLFFKVYENILKKKGVTTLPNGFLTSRIIVKVKIINKYQFYHTGKNIIKKLHIKNQSFKHFFIINMTLKI